MDPEEGGAWKLWCHRQDESVLYKAKERPDYYEVKRPNAPDVGAFYMPKDAFEEVYEPVPKQEETSG